MQMYYCTGTYFVHELMYSVDSWFIVHVLVYLLEIHDCQSLPMSSLCPAEILMNHTTIP